MLCGDQMTLTESQKELIELFRDTEEPVLTATEIAETFHISQQAAYDRLKRLEESGTLNKKEVGSRAVVWWLEGSQSNSASC